MKRVKSQIALLSLALFIGCTEDPNLTKIQYAPDMADSPTVKIQENYLDPPEGSVDMKAILYPKTAEEAEKIYKNPFAESPEFAARLAEGKKTWEVYCLMCHGPQGKGNGTMTDVYPRAANITDAVYTKRKDGFFFHRITFGWNQMWGYGHSLSPDERWEIVLYLRQLQKVAKK